MPNLATFSIRFHYGNENGKGYQDVISEDLFLSGGKYFEENDLSFKKENNIKNAFHDILTIQEQKQFLEKNPSKRGIYLGKVLEEKIRTRLVGGAWKNNCHDSESILLLSLNKSIPSILKRFILDNYKESSLELQAVVLYIKSLRDPCWRCS